ncbi:hypothetical protein [Frankia sp. Cas4]|uniref:hypothetical protein n=1 Tax=Frankia sp. Cas4 TaxID=3073927 RepID=UPI002AD48161|nr:hypothetical protein [Frankia sp. Cas4]
MRRMNLRDVPDEIYTALAEGAAASHQSLNVFVVERLTEMARVTRLADYMASYEAPQTAGVTAPGRLSHSPHAARSTSGTQVAATQERHSI